MQASEGRVPIFMDGGVRRGTDIFKALALGASGVFVSIIRSEFHAIIIVCHYASNQYQF